MIRTLCVLLALSIVLSAAEPVAKVTSPEPFQLRGQTVQVAGVPAWSALVGDEITAGASPVVVTFKDGSKAVLAAKAKGKIDKAKEDSLAFHLTMGMMTVTAAQNPGVKFYSGQTIAPVQPGQSLTVSVGQQVRPAFVRTPTVPPGPAPTSTR